MAGAKVRERWLAHLLFRSENTIFKLFSRRKFSQQVEECLVFDVVSQSILPFCSPSLLPDCFPDRASSYPSPFVRAAFLSSGFYWLWWLLGQLANSCLNVRVGTKAHTSVWLFICLFIETVSGLGSQSFCLSLPSVWIPGVCHHAKLGTYSFTGTVQFLWCPVKSEGWLSGGYALGQRSEEGGLLEGTHWDRVWLSELWSWCSLPHVPFLFSFDST